MCRHVSANFPPDITSVPAARRLVQRQLANWEVEDSDGIVALLVTELVTNVVVHAQTDVEVVVAVAEGTVEVAVADGSRRTVWPLRLVWTSERGRGLLLLDRLADLWGVQPNERGKSVWFRVAIPDSWPWRQQCPCHGADLHETVLLGSGNRVKSLSPN